jgi:GNAT superfamily N-acetyltransferase
MNYEIYNLYKNSDEYTIWPIKEGDFNNILYGTEDLKNETEVFEHREGGEILGVISVKHKKVGEENKGSIIFLFVQEEHRKQGVGTDLLEKGIKWLKTRKVKEVKFGGGAGSYFWPGLPKNLEMRSFFEKHGFDVDKNGPVDMSGEITNYQPPEGVYSKMRESGVEIEVADEFWADRILEFTKKNFLRWFDYYEDILKKEEYDKIFFAHSADEVVAVSILWQGDCKWRMLFDGKVGGGACLGVSKDWRGKGIGLAMKSWGTEKLLERGVQYVWIDYTYAVDFYRKLGFKIWREYYEVEKEV